MIPNRPATRTPEEEAKFNSPPFQENLLKKTAEHTDDIEEMKRIAKYHSRAAVMRSLDKMGLRKDFHNSLADSGLGTDDIVTSLKKHLTSDSPKIALRATEIFMKSLGLDKYETFEENGRPWEEVLLKLQTAEREGSQISDGGVKHYEVNIPIIPDSAQELRAEENKMGKELYESNRSTTGPTDTPASGS